MSVPAAQWPSRVGHRNARPALDEIIEENDDIGFSIANGHHNELLQRAPWPQSSGLRRGLHADHPGVWRQPNYFSSRPNPASYSEPVEATVKWFNADKGFGFVLVAGEPDAFLPARALEAAGHSSVPDGARIKVRISQGQKGPQVAEVVEVDRNAAQRTSRTERRPASRPSSQRPGVGPIEECLGSVKWYNVEKGFGFEAARPRGEGRLRSCHDFDRSGSNELTEGQRVRMQIDQGQKGPEARSIELLD